MEITSSPSVGAKSKTWILITKIIRIITVIRKVIVVVVAVVIVAVVIVAVVIVTMHLVVSNKTPIGGRMLCLCVLCWSGLLDNIQSKILVSANS